MWLKISNIYDEPFDKRGEVLATVSVGEFTSVTAINLDSIAYISYQKKTNSTCPRIIFKPINADSSLRILYFKDEDDEVAEQVLDRILKAQECCYNLKINKALVDELRCGVDGLQAARMNVRFSVAGGQSNED